MSKSVTEEVLATAGEILASFGRLDPSMSAGQRSTKTIVFKGPQTASTVLHFQIPWNCFLSYVQFSVAGFLCSRVSKTYAGLVASSFDLSVVAFRGNSEPNLQPWIGSEEFSANDIIFFDTAGGMGAADTARFVFDIKANVEEQAHVGL